jgi:hypothetical protein
LARTGKSIFISYRRSDSEAVGQVNSWLRRDFDDAVVFLDVADIEASEQWRARLSNTIAAASVMIVFIGAGWIQAVQQPESLIRWEIEAALARTRPQPGRRPLLIIPVLLHDCPPIDGPELPSSLRPLAAIQQGILRPDAYAERDYDELARQVANRVPRVRNPFAWKSRRRLAFGASALAAVLGVTAAVSALIQPQINLGQLAWVSLAELLLISSATMGLRPTKSDAFIVPYVITTIVFVAALWAGLAADFGFPKSQVAGLFFLFVLALTSLLVIARRVTIVRYVKNHGAGGLPMGFTPSGTAERVEWTPYFALAGFLILSVFLVIGRYVGEPADRGRSLLYFLIALLLLLVLRLFWFFIDSSGEDALQARHTSDAR